MFGKLFALKDKILSLSLGYLSNNLLIDLELNALEAGGFGEIVSQPNSVGSVTVNAEPAIDITEITTQALVGNGQTLVLGGIFQSEELSDIVEVPILGDIPLLGNLFKKQMRAKDKREILIFITPKIIDENFIDT